MIKLTREQIKPLIPLYEGHITQELEYAYRGETPFGPAEIGVYVDNIGKPNSILLIGCNVGTVLYGDTGNEGINQEIKKLIWEYSDVKREKIWLSLLSSEWEPVLDKMFAKMHTWKDNRLIHRLNKKIFQNHYSWQDKIPNGYVMKKYDTSSHDFIQKRDWQGFWHPESERFGWFLMKDDEIVSECTSVWVEKVGVETGYVEIGIETKEPYRGKGYATITCAAFINDCISRDLIPVWCCWNSTPGSKELAKKIGFEIIEDRCSIFIKR